MICVLGANGLSGRAIMTQLASLNPIGILRQPSDDPFFANKSTAIADVMDIHQCQTIFQHYHPKTIISVIGGKKEGIRSDAIGNINLINAAQQYAPNAHFILITSMGCGEQWTLLGEPAQTFLGEAIKAKNQAEHALQQSKLTWTILRPCGLNMAEHIHYQLVKNVSQMPNEYISRKALALAIEQIMFNTTLQSQIYSIIP